MNLTPFLIWLVCVGIGAVIVGYLIRNYDTFSKPYAEGFAVMNSCPAGTNEYVDGQGRRNCCRRDIVNGQCSDILCSLSNVAGGPIFCDTYFRQQLSEKSKEFCPPSAPNYYDTGKEKGCTASAVNAQGIPESASGSCKVYTDSKAAMSNADSCALKQAMDRVVCPTTDAKKSLVSTGEKDMPLLIACTYSTAKSVVPTTCYDDDSVGLWLSSKYGGEWMAKLAEKGLSGKENLNFCKSSEGYYVKDTIKKEQIAF